MPKIKSALRKMKPIEKLREIKSRAEEKKASGSKITVAELEERVKAIEEVINSNL